MGPRSDRSHDSESTTKTDYEVKHSGGKARSISAFLNHQPRLPPQQVPVSAKSSTPAFRQVEHISDELLLPAAAWQPERTEQEGANTEDEAPAHRARGLSKALTFRKSKGTPSGASDLREKKSLQELHTTGGAEESREHSSVNEKLKRFSLRSKPKELNHENGDGNTSGVLSKKASLTAFFGVSDSSARAPHSPREPFRSKPPSITSIGSKNDSLISLSGEASGSNAPIESSEEKGKLSVSSLRKKDELAGIIKALEGDYSKFQSKPMALKANIVRTSLLVFLKNYSMHPSNKRLSAEDLDRRTLLLNKWWIGLLDMLDARNIQDVAGLDRPAIFEGISGIMERPEWRCAPSKFSPLMERQVYAANNRTRSDTSTGSGGSDSLLESVHHNVRNMFIQNLYTQMVLVADRMSVRNAPATLVAFCGKCCAYAFFFCPGMADVLVRQWDISASKIKQVMSVLDLPHDSKLSLASETIAANFPRGLHSLRLEPCRHMIRKLKEKPIAPSRVNIPWQGFWESRWSGKESDLFYIFLRHAHILASEFLPANPSKLERACAPGMVLIYSQMLPNLNSTLHRQITQKKGGNDVPAASFDDIMDAKVMPFPTTVQLRNIPPNASRLMAENRYIMLLRDALEGRTSSCPAACLLFAEGFADVLKTSVAAISVYNHDACFTLCDFLQEALVILVSFELNTALEVSLIDWAFWFKVLKQMSQSENTMTDIRLFALLYTIWPTLTTYAPWRVSLCLDFLLDEDFFVDKFDHWCPMVRTYYMRLLCWRIARVDTEMEPSDDDIEILETLSTRLRRAWSEFSAASRIAKVKGRIPYQVTPSNPAPNRRLIILRTEAPFTSSLTSLSSLGPSSLYDRSAGVVARSQPSSWSTGFSSGPSASQVADSLMSDLEFSPEIMAKKKLGRFRNLLGVATSDVTPRSHGGSSSPSWSSSRNPSPDRSRSSLIQGHSPRILEQRSPMLGARSPRFDARKTSQSPLMEALSPRLAAEANGSSPRLSGSASTKSRSGSDVNFTPGHFKFSLESTEKRPQTIPVDLSFHPPRLPPAAHTLLQSQLGPAAELGPTRHKETPARNVAYAGRALAEWTLVVLEHQHFIERRRNEGVPSNKLVETPTLSVDSFRKVA